MSRVLQETFNAEGRVAAPTPGVVLASPEKAWKVLAWAPSGLTLSLVLLFTLFPDVVFPSNVNIDAYTAPSSMPMPGGPVLTRFQRQWLCWSG